MSCSTVFLSVSICESFRTRGVSISLPNVHLAEVVSSTTLFGFPGELGGCMRHRAGSARR